MGSLRPDVIQVANMSMKWGYTERSRGSITGSQMKAVPIMDGWRLSFRGGKFSQNWLKKLQIEELDVVITRQGIDFEKAIFSKNGGSLILDEFKVSAGQRPIVSGKMKMKGIDISSMLPVVARTYVEGKISGDFVVSGSSNTTQGIKFVGEVKLEEGDVITLRDRIPLLRALSVVDTNQTYRRVDFKIGSFQLEMQEKGLVVSNVKLFADDTLSLKGGMFVRKPKSDEELVLDDGSDFFGEIIKSDEEIENVDISLREAGEASNNSGSRFLRDADRSLFDKLAVLRENRRISRSYRYEGEFQITLMKTAFDRAPELKEAYPASSGDGRIPMTVPIKGVLYELTSELANEIYEKGRR
jgi:hypothetical protein